MADLRHLMENLFLRALLVAISGPVFSIFLPFTLGQNQDLLGCGGFVKSVVPIQYSRVEIKMYTKQGSLKYQTECAPNNGYYYVPIYDKGEYILKVEPPEGWTFEPQLFNLNIQGNDPCSLQQDLNFIFKGFSIFGQVTSKGSNDGPSGVTISLLSPDNKELKKTHSGKGGSYFFSGIIPGDYRIKSAHQSLKLQQGDFPVKVKEDNVNIDANIVVLGYDVRGRVISDKEPIKGVYFILFSESKIDEKSIIGCTLGLPSAFKSEHKEWNPICHIASDEKGEFAYSSLPVGNYMLVPFYKGEKIKFDVKPALYKFAINHESILLDQKFEVQGFSVSGKVTTSLNGKGVSGAAILVNNKVTTQTNSDGVFYLENMKAGVYNILVQADQIYFDPVTVRITPNTPDIPEIVASAFDVSGQVIFTQSLPTVSGPVVRSVSISSSGEKPLIQSMLVEADAEGKFATKLPPGAYEIRAAVTDAEREMGLLFVPEVFQIKVVDKSVSSVYFHEFKASIHGTIECIEKCKDIKVVVKPLGQLALKPIEANVVDGQFSASQLLPGEYDVAIEKKEWCWVQTTLKAKITKSDVKDLKFKQNGYRMIIDSSHGTMLDYNNNNGNKGTIELRKGFNEACLDAKGIYALKPIGCHRFAPNEPTFNTNNPSVTTTLTATHHLLSGVVYANVNATHIVLNVKSTQDGAEETIKLASSSSTTKNPNNGLYEYGFSYWASPAQTLEFTPSSDKLLFLPEKKSIVMLDDCMQNVIELTGTKGMFINGKVNPPLEKVKITIVAEGVETRERSTMEPIVLYTGKDGRYQVGPLRGSLKYIITAEKQGYILSQGAELGAFEAYKLAEVIVEMVDSNKQPLSGVLISLSGDGDYRQNTMIQDDGTINFSGLGPGQYFIRPMMKEFKFEPPNKVIEVKEGATLKVQFLGNRVAFSCLGYVSSLSGEPEPGIIVEAVGLGNCSLSQDEASSEADGSFRIRGLLPNCDYELKLKKAPGVNQHIERSIPSSKLIQVSSGDIIGINVIVFRPVTQMDVTGRILTENDYLNSLKVILTKAYHPEQAVHTLSISGSSFFQLPRIPIDQSQYIMTLETTLPRSQYEFDLPEVQFKANLSYQHFTLRFNPLRKATDHDITQGSYLALPLAILLILAAINYNKLLPFLTQLGSSLPSLINTNFMNREGIQGVDQSTRKKVKPRKTQ